MSSPDLSEAAVARAVAEAEQAIAAAATSADLKAVKAAHVADGSPLALANRGIANLPGPERKDAGQRIGRARKQVGAAFAARSEAIAAAEVEAQLAAESVDVTAPVPGQPVGARHPLTALMDLMSDIFTSMGWEIADGPEIEAEWFIFDALNMGPDHPTRTTRDTLWTAPLEQRKVLRTETSNAQIHTLLTQDPPVYVISPGRVYRADEIDATHLPVFTQIEGLAVDRGLTFGDLRGTLDHFARAMFGDVATRVRPHFFPFTEPSAEMDVQCFVCRGESGPDAPCRTCKSTGWIEWGGCGMVNPRVLVACGIDPQEFTGFAFGMGVERALMLRNEVADIRDIVEGDVRFSRALLGGAR